MYLLIYKYNFINLTKKNIKYLFVILLIILSLLNSHKNIINIEINNKISEFEENIDFSNNKTEIKAIALYLPQFHVIEENDKFWGKGFTEWVNVKKCKPIYKGHHQPRIPGDNFGYLSYYDLSDIKAIEKQIKLAKSHGIYGFGIYYYWFSGKKLLEKPINLFIKISSIHFKFLLIWANENWSRRYDGSSNEILIKQEYKPNDPNNFIKDIKKYVKDSRYIKIDKKPVIGLYKPYNIPQLKKTILIWREKSREIGIGEIFILICVTYYKIKNFEDLNLFDGCYEFPPLNPLAKSRILNKKAFIYTKFLYLSRDFKEPKVNFTKFPFFRGVMLEWDNCPRKKNCVIFANYSPQQFYIFNKIIIDWTIKNYNKDLRFIFINAWNEWGEGTYLEPDEKYGYSSINYLSKSIFNFSYCENLSPIRIGAIIVLVYISNSNIDSIKELIKKINNIPYTYDLFIITDTKIKNDNLKHYINHNSNANYSELLFLLNEGTYFKTILLNFKKKLKKYKYICNLNLNEHKNISYFEDWKNYLFNNLLGDSKIVSEIISDFEHYKNLGIIFPEKYIKSLIQFGDCLNDLDIKYINLILNKIYPKINIAQKLIDFPEGNMFWAKINIIYPIFKLFSNIFFSQKNIIILKSHLEKIWIFIAKMNGFFYKTIFKHL